MWRRTRYAFFYLDDSVVLDLDSVLRAERDAAQASTETVIYALSLLREEIVELQLAAFEVLLSIPSHKWIGPSELRDRDGVPFLVDMGLVLNDEESGAAATFRRRDAALESCQWHPQAAAYHVMTKWKDVRVPFTAAARESPDAAAELQDRVLEDFVRAVGPPPPHFHSVPGAETVALPLERRNTDLYQILRRRRTTRAFDAAQPTRLSEFSSILYYVFGCHGLWPLSHGIAGIKRTSPSGGGLHPIEVYPLVLRVQGLDTGIYHYNAQTHTLEVLRLLSLNAGRDLADEFTAGQCFPVGADALLLFTARFYRSYWKYRCHNRALAVILLDAGHLSQTFYLVCEELGLGAFVTAAINGSNIETELGLDGISEGAILVAGCGRPNPAGSPWDPAITPGEPPFPTI